MTESTIKNHVSAFGMSGYLISAELKQVENKFNIELGHIKRAAEQEEARYYTQFEQSVRVEASNMSQHYELFYCLETSIRKLISETLTDAEGGNWWSSDRVPEKIRNDVTNRTQRELDSGITRRSDNEIDYTTFGELSVIIADNWDVFGAIFNNHTAVKRVMRSLNLLRGPIAHCCPITEDEIDRLNLTVKDWFRIMA